MKKVEKTPLKIGSVETKDGEYVITREYYRQDCVYKDTAGKPMGFSPWDEWRLCLKFGVAAGVA